MKKGFLYASVVCLLIFVNYIAAAENENFMGDESDGSRAVPVHVIELFTQDGDKIRPDDQPLLPFSTNQTCVKCHSYNAVKGGWHFNAMDSNVPAGRVRSALDLRG